MDSIEECRIISENLILSPKKISLPNVESLNTISGFEILVSEEEQKNLLKKLIDQSQGKNELSEIYQLFKVTQLPGIRKIIAHSDFHLGYSFPIGTVAKFDLNDPNLKIYPGAIGGDINCGMRIIATPFTINDFDYEEEGQKLSRRSEFADKLRSIISAGISKKGNHDRKNEYQLKSDEIIDILENGLESLSGNGSFAKRISKYFEGIEIIGESNRVENRGKQALSKNIKEKFNKNKLLTAQFICSLGSGNHFLEI